MKAIQKHSFSTLKLMILFWFLCLSLQHTDCSQGEECSCEVMMKGACTSKIIGKIKGKFFEQERPFSLVYIPLKESEKVVATFFVWANSYHCEEAKGYICDKKVINNTFSVSVSKVEKQSTIQACVEGKFKFSAEGEDGIICKLTQNRTPVSHQDYGQHTEKDRKPVSHQDYGQHPEKISVQLENNETFPEKTSGNSNEAESSFAWIGLFAGFVFGFAIVGVAVLFLHLRQRCYNSIRINTTLALI